MYTCAYMCGLHNSLSLSLSLSHLLTLSHTRLKDLGLPKDHAPLYLIIDNKTVVEGALTLKEVYDTRQNKGDKYRHIAYSSTEPEKSLPRD